MSTLSCFLILLLGDIERKIKVVVIEGLKEPIILVSTDLALSIAQIIEIYGARFTIEIAIRDLKEHFGLANYQCYRHTAISAFRFCESELL